MTDKKTIGFVGLGLMGTAMTGRLMEQGHDVVGFDIDAEKLANAEKTGVRPAASAAVLTEAADIVLVCVTSTAAVEQVVFGNDGIAEAGAAGKVLVDHSTTVTEATRDMAARLAADCGMAWVDAPVSGGPPASAAGTLAIMVGGDTAAVATVEPVLRHLGRPTHMGPVGAGQVTKMINQVLVLNNYAVLAEAVRLAENAGIDTAKVPDCLAGGHADSNMLKAIWPRMVARDYAPAGYARQVLKDLEMVQDLAGKMKSPTPMSSQAAMLFRLLIARGYSELDGIAVLKLYDSEPV